MTFVESARRLAGQTGVLLGWRPGEFWAATPEELAAVIDAMRGDGLACAGANDLARLQEIYPDG